MTWGEIGGEIGVSSGVVYRYAILGREPRNNAIRANLGLLPRRWIVTRKVGPRKANYRRALVDAMALLWGERKTT